VRRGQGHRIWAPRGNPGDERRAYRHQAPPRQLPTRLKHGVSKRTFNYLRAIVWRRVVCWLRRKHPRASWKWLRRRYLPRWWPTDGEVTLVNPGAVVVSRYRYRGRIPSPWAEQPRPITGRSR
jgi:Group II intron, maturase-specific domain